MHPPSAAIAGNPGGGLDDPPNQPLHGPFDVLALQMEVPDHLQQVVGQSPHLQPGLVGFKPVIAGLVPMEGVFGLFGRVFHIDSAIVDPHHFPGRKGGVGDDEAHPVEKLTGVAFDLAHHPAAFLPSPGTIGKLEVQCIDA